MTQSAPETLAVRCRQCGGAVAAIPGAPLPACLFCGAEAEDLESFAPDPETEPPEGFIDFAVDKSTVDDAFRTFARSSFWYPNDLRNADLDLKQLLLPAWAWSGEAETHWAGLISASTRSGKRPVSGADIAHFEQVLVPASQTLTLKELHALGNYDEAALAPFEPETATAPYELSEVTRTAARQAARNEMTSRHRAAIAATENTVSLNASSIVSSLDGHPVLVPVWIGAYRYGDKVYRVLVNGQTGTLSGHAPTSLWKRLFVAVALLLVLAAIGLAFSVCAGGSVLLGS